MNNKIANQYKSVIKEAVKSYCFAGFCHHHLAVMSAHTHVYYYPLFESGMKTVCEQWLYVEKTCSTIAYT